jgi:D-3-phosphoglycerate dehydrogenase
MASAAFNCEILTVTRTTSNLPDYVRSVEFDELLSKSDVVVLSCPLNDQTRGMFNEKAFAKLKQGALLINVSRGPVIIESALLNALQKNMLGGAALDVFQEHPLPPDNPLFGFENVILTPHMAGITTESMVRMGQGVVDEIRRIKSGDLPMNFINPEVLPLYNSRFRQTIGQ